MRLLLIIPKAPVIESYYLPQRRPRVYARARSIQVHAALPPEYKEDCIASVQVNGH
jgi:hypothetical protein